MSGDFRLETDALGELEVPADAYWGINTQRAIQNFQISERRFPRVFIEALVGVKKAALLANMELGLLGRDIGDAMLQATDEILHEHRFLDQFPLDVFQTGSGTQVNMNANEVIANRAAEILGHPKGKKFPVHPNDHVNKCQSSNDVIPTAMHLAVVRSLLADLVPALEELRDVLTVKVEEFGDIVKVGRTHLQDAVPIPLSTEFEVYRKQVEDHLPKLRATAGGLGMVPLGGTAVGTGINAPLEFATLAAEKLSEITGLDFRVMDVKAAAISSHNALVGASGVVRDVALTLLKMANDIRWMGSGPRAGLSELLLPKNEPGSSIMPGKVNPTQSEALIQVCLQVLGNDSVVANAEGYGSVLDLNVCKPLLVYNLLDSISILSRGARSFVEHCLRGLRANTSQIEAQVERILMIVTNLVPVIGYDKASEVALKAEREGKTIREVVGELGLDLGGRDLGDLLDPSKMV
ncbi:MAG: class II fumarate hydratase [Promethearchaeota archaeon]